MGVIDFVILGVIIVIIGAAVGYIIKKKKSGVRCIGCSSAGECAKKYAQKGCGCTCKNNAE